MKIKSIQSLVVYLNQAKTAVVGLDVAGTPISVTHGTQTQQSNPVPLMSQGARDRTEYKYDCYY